MSYRDRLARLVKSKNLGDINYQNVSNKSGRFIGTVKIAGRKFTSYPEEFLKVEEAYESVAKEAYNEFKSTTEEHELPLSDDSKLITQRVIDIVGTESTGYWSHILPERYTKDFNERLPTNWLDIVLQMTDSIMLHKMADGKVALYPTTQNNSKYQTEEKELNLKKTDLIGSTLFAAQSEPIPASLPESGSLMVHVLVVHAADRVSSIIILERKSFNWNTTIYRFRLIHKCDILGGEGNSPLLLSSFISLMWRISLITVISSE